MDDQLIFIRPYIQYEASTAILCRAGSDLGATLTGHHDFQLADDVIHKVHVGHYTFYSVSIVKNTKLLQKAQGIFCRGYRGGEGTSQADVIRCDFGATPAAGGGGGMSGSFFSTLNSSMLVPSESDRAEFTAKMAEMVAQNGAVGGVFPPAAGAAGPVGAGRPRMAQFADYLLVQQLLTSVGRWREESDSLFTDVESHSDEDRLHGLLLVKGTHVSRDHVYVNPLGLGPVTYSGSSRSREGKGDALDKGQTISELDSIQRRLIQVI